MNYIFLDRDGTLNLDNGYVHRTEDLFFIDGVKEFLSKYKNKFKFIIITNQAGIAKKKFTLQDMQNFNMILVSKLKEVDIKIEAIYYCPHHVEGLVAKYSISCDCRKPAPGLLKKAASEFDITKSKSLIIGDKFTDILAGYNFGLTKGFLISDDKNEIDKLEKLNCDAGLKFRSVDTIKKIKI